MSAVWCVKCNLSTIILLKSHAKSGAWRLREPGNTACQRTKVGFDPLGARAIRHQARRGMKRQRIFSVAQLGMSSEECVERFRCLSSPPPRRRRGES